MRISSFANISPIFGLSRSINIDEQGDAFELLNVSGL